MTLINGCVTRALHILNQEASSDLARVVHGHEDVIGNTIDGEIGEGQIFMERGQVTPTNGYVMGALHIPSQEPSGDFGGGIYFNENFSRNNGRGQVDEEIAGAQIFMEGGYQNTYQGTEASPNDIAEKQLTDDDIDELLREI